jgi:hypothetical protein
MKRLKAIVSENGNVSVIEEIATVLTENDIVIDEVSYDIIGNEEFNEQLESWINTQPKWLQVLIKKFGIN